MPDLRVSLIRYISDDPQPGIVEAEFADAHGRVHRFIEKTAIVSAEDIDARSHYPRPGAIRCTIVESTRNVEGRDIVLVDTETIDGVESTEGVFRFDVAPQDLAS